MLEHTFDAVQDTMQGMMAVVVMRAMTHVVMMGFGVVRTVMRLGGVGVGARWWWRTLGEAGGEAEFAKAGFDFLADVSTFSFRSLHFAYHVGYNAAEDGGALFAAVAEGGRAQGEARDCELEHLLVIMPMNRSCWTGKT